MHNQSGVIADWSPAYRELWGGPGTCSVDCGSSGGGSRAARAAVCELRAAVGEQRLYLAGHSRRRRRPSTSGGTPATAQAGAHSRSQARLPRSGWLPWA